MKNFLTILIFCLFCSLGYGQETRSLSTFHEVDVSTGVKVILTKGNEHKAIIEVENCDSDEVITDVSGDRLVVKFKNNKGSWKNRKATVTVYYQSLEGVSASSGGSMTGKNPINSDQLDVNGSSGGTIDLEVEAGNIDMDVSSGGVVTMSGHVGALVLDVSSGGVFRGYELKAKSANADASSGGMARITVTEDLNADASSGGSIQYKGDPSRVKVDASISGSIKSKS